VIHGSKTLLMQSTDGQITERIPFRQDYYQALVLCTLHLYATGRAQFISITDEQAMQWGVKTF
jgi:tryptophan synthase beta chain